MKLNVDKTKIMIINYTHNYQFRTRLCIDNTPIQIVDQAKLLGTIISSDLKWDCNTKSITKRAYARMGILHKLIEYNVPTNDMVLIYILYIRSVLEQSAVVWHSSLTQENRSDLERVQKTALKIILQDKYNSYNSALQQTDLNSLEDRRQSLCLSFARKCLKHEEMKALFPLRVNRTSAETRSSEKFIVFPANTDRLKKSALIHMQQLLNEDDKSRKNN